MKYCEYCGTKLFPEDRTCPKCGARIVDDEDSSNLKQENTNNLNNKDFKDSNSNNYNNQNINQQNHRYGNFHSSSTVDPMIKNRIKVKKIVREITLIFMILSCIGFGILIIPLIWMLPMVLHYYSVSVKSGKDVSITFKICTLLFCNFIAGILMICNE